MINFNMRRPVFVALIFLLPALSYAQPSLPGAYPVGTKINYVRTWDALAPEQDASNLMTRPMEDVRMTTQYLDGLGRPLQTVVKQGSLATGGTATDIVSTVVYDEFGRERIKYLPYAEASAADGLFKSSPFITQANFYNSQLIGQVGETNVGPDNLNWAYNQTNFEASPLNRPQENFAPGVSWVGSAGQANEVDRRSVKAKYWINTLTDNVKIWQVSNSTNKADFGTYTIDITNNNGKYAAGQLFKTVSIDEHGKQVIEFKDKEGKVILKKVQIGTTTGIADDGAGRGYDGWLSTYYIYDDLNNLRCVIQPEAVNTLNLNVNNAPVLTTTLLNEQCFRYEYDHRNRMIMKKVPGAGEVYMVYDRRDRLVMTQDANMRNASTQKWLITKYDALNRPQETGIWQNGSTTFENHLIAANIATIDYPTTTTGYETLTLTHYDDYTGLPTGLSSFLTTWNTTEFAATDNNNFPYPQMPTVSTATKTMVTWTQVKVLGTSTFLNSVTYYDGKGRPIQVQSTNLTGGTDVATTQYSWAGQPLVMINKQQKAGTNAQENLVITKMQYDDLGRVISVKKTVKALIASVETLTPEVEIVKNEYDALGQLKTKHIGKKKDANGSYTTTPLESLQYDYNIRGLLLGMNRNYVSSTGQNSNSKFGFELGYDKISNVAGRNFMGAGLFNGNISGMIWKSDGDDVKRKYDFSYDAANRLLKGQFEQEDGKASWNNTTMDYSMQMGDGADPTLAYDANGNIKAMQQKGWKLGAPTALIDDLSYHYFTGTNKLQRVTDENNDFASKLGDFKYNPVYKTLDDYAYDYNGNLKTDNNKSIAANVAGDGIRYNYLNLPEFINVFGKGSIAYTYDAAGNKIRKDVFENASISNGNRSINTITTYINGFVYESKTTNPADPDSPDYTDKLLFTGMEEGRVRPIFTQNVLQGFAFDYMIKDHLGNVRMVLTDETKTDDYFVLSFEGSANSTEVNLQKAVWEDANGTEFDVVGKRTQNAQLQNASNLIPATQTYSLLVRSSTGKIGAGKLLKVMSGDKIHTTVQYYFATNSGTTGDGFNTLLAGLNTLLTNSIGSQGFVKDNPAAATAAVAGNTNAINYFTSQNNNSSTSRPKAYLNVLFFDEQFNFDESSSYSEQVGAVNPGQIVIAQGNAKQANKNGYCYIYISNESNDMVHFDNFSLSHERGPILEETHYYPFGLTMAGISSKAAGGVQNKFNFAGKELQSKEFSEGIGLEEYDFGARFYDPQVGRFFTQDRFADSYHSLNPYQYTSNNPINFSDYNGDYITIDKKDENGNVMLSLLYEDNKAYFYTKDTNGKVVKGEAWGGTDEFIKGTVSDLNSISDFKEGKSLIGDLQSSSEKVGISKFSGVNSHFDDGGSNDIGYNHKNSGFHDGVKFDKSFVKLGHELAHAWDKLIGHAEQMYNTVGGGALSTEKNAVRFENYLRAMSGETTMRTKYGGVNLGFPNSSSTYFKNFIFPLRKEQFNMRLDPSSPPIGIYKDETNVRKDIYQGYDTRTQKFIMKQN